MIAIIAILAAILFPVFARAREKARQTSCASNLKQLMLAAIMYTQDYDEKGVFFAQAHDYGDVDGDGDTNERGLIHSHLLNPYIRNSQIHLCPSDDAEYRPPAQDPFHYMSYGIAYSDLAHYDWGVSWARIEQPSTVVYFADGSGWLATSRNGDRTDFRHNEMANVAFCDGHVKAMSEGALLGNDAHWPDLH